jgi:hypothetical protein
MSDGLDEAADTAAEHVAASAADPSAPGAKARPSRTATLRPNAEPGHCANCGTKLQGPVCHHCGQLDDEFHRPVRGLAGEIIEGLFALDGRVARTIPNLLLRPGRITRAYLKGQRARFMPPFRLYIIASLVFFLLAPLATNSFNVEDAELLPGALETSGEARQIINEAIESGDLTPEEVAETRAALDQLGLGGLIDDIEARVEAQSDEAGAEATTGADPSADPAEGEAPEPQAPAGAPEREDGAAPLELGLERGDGAEGLFSLGDGDGETTAEAIRRFFVPESFGEPAPENAWPRPVRAYLGDRFARVAEDPGAWLEEAADWIPRIMFAMVPVYALLLSLTYAWRRGFFLYDHLIVSVHFHAALFLSMTVFYLASYALGGWMVLAFLIYSNLYLYRIHRVVYERGRISSVLRTLALDFVYAVMLALGLVATLLLGALAV